MFTRLCCAAVTAILITGPLSATEIERMEPPFWWQGFQHEELQLLVYGKGIGEFEPAVDYDGVSISRVERVKSPNYLFVYLSIDASAKDGWLDLTFTKGSETIDHRYELREKNPDPAYTEGFSQKDAIYLLMPDRFANGDTSNDVSERLGDVLDRDDDYARHGGDLAGVIDNLDYIADMGFTQIWLNPILENRVARASYHGYSTTDYYLVDPRFGTNEQYRELVAKARNKGIGIIKDLIVNHIGDGHWWMQDLPTHDWLNFQEERTITSHARTVNQDAYASEYDRMMHVEGWFDTSMPDLNQQNPLLADYLIQNAIWWIEYVGLTGIRQDTWPYPHKDFMTEWARRIMEEYPHFNIVGEEWSLNPAIVSYWQRGKQNPDGYVSYLPSVFDFPLQDALVTSLTGEVPDWDSVWTKTYGAVANDFLYPDPGNLVIFPDNHDMDRIYTQVGEDYDLYRMAMVFFATMRGIPQFFYGDEILMSHTGTSSHGALRIDMPGGWDGDDRDAFSGKNLSDDETRAQNFVRKLLNWRKTADVIHSGAYMHYAPIKDIFAYFRYDETDTVMVILNRSEETETLPLSRFTERLQDAAFGTDVLTGKRFSMKKELVLEPRSALLLELE
ncbi:MAG: glycoside hydrolase family 13 protein [Woeseiaceae bacterium]|nr:glycoside hydrolase family 13 protein [Woeseiaceae bacterium]